MITREAIERTIEDLESIDPHPNNKQLRDMLASLLGTILENQDDIDQEAEDREQAIEENVHYQDNY